jgi:hypothetical protein
MSEPVKERQSSPTSPGNGADELARLLDEVVARLASRRRTLTDEEALQPVWDGGYEITPQMDPRFTLARDADGRNARQWRLATQILGNNRLLERLDSSDWNGYGLDAELARLDEADGTHYVFCPVDARFRVRADGRYELADREPSVAIPPQTRQALDALEPSLLKRWRAEGGDPWTAQHIVLVLSELGWSEAPLPAAWRVVGAWLKSLSSVTRVGQDFWLPTDFVPEAPRRSRLQVVPVFATKSPSEPELTERPDESPSLPRPQHILEEPQHPREPRNPDESVLPVGTLEQPEAHWTIPLRTIHLVEGFLPVPRSARHAYPRRRDGEGDRTVMPALWFETGDNLWVWLDRQQDRLFGPALAERLAWLEAGDRLQVELLSRLINFRLVGHDDAVRREETRLVDVESLAAARRDRGESYLRALQAILGEVPAGLTFAEIVRGLGERQGHEVHRGTVRALLHAGGFIPRDGRWFAASDVQHAKRQVEMVTDHLVGSLQHSQEEPGRSTTQTKSSGDLRTTVREIRDRLAEIVAQLRSNKRLDR